MDDQLKDNLTDKASWTRAIYLILFYVILKVVELIVGVIALVQFGLLLFTRSANDNLKESGETLAEYMKQIVMYLTVRTDEKPYPFAPWPKKNM